MSDRKKQRNGETQSNSGGKSTGDENAFMIGIHELSEIVSGLVKRVNGAKNVQELVDIQNELQAKVETQSGTISEQRGEIAYLKNKNKQNCEFFEERAAVWSEKKDMVADLQQENHKLQGVIEELQGANDELKVLERKNMELSRRNDDFKRLISRHEANIAKLRADIQLQNVELESAKAECAKCQQKLMGSRALEIKVGDIAKSFDTFVRDLRGLIFRNFNQDIEDFQKSGMVGVEVKTNYFPLSSIANTPSNAEAIRLMRCVMAEVIMAQELVRGIFLENYFPDGDAMLRKLEGFVDHKSGLVDEVEVIRMQFASGGRKISSQTIAQSTAAKVTGRLKPWLKDPSGFEAALTRLLTGMVEIWKSVQGGTDRPQGIFAVTQDEFWLVENMDVVSEYDSPTTQGKGKPALAPSPDRAVVDLFPYIGLGEEVLFPGQVLFSTQNVFVAAQAEYQRYRTEVDGKRRPSLNSNSRRMGRSNIEGIPQMSFSDRQAIMSTSSGSAVSAKRRSDGGVSSVAAPTTAPTTPATTANSVAPT